MQASWGQLGNSFGLPPMTASPLPAPTTGPTFSPYTPPITGPGGTTVAPGTPPIYSPYVPPTTGTAPAAPGGASPGITDPRYTGGPASVPGATAPAMPPASAYVQTPHWSDQMSAPQMPGQLSALDMQQLQQMEQMKRQSGMAAEGAGSMKRMFFGTLLLAALAGGGYFVYKRYGAQIRRAL